MERQVQATDIDSYCDHRLNLILGLVSCLYPPNFVQARLLPLAWLFSAWVSYNCFPESTLEGLRL